MLSRILLPVLCFLSTLVLPAQSVVQDIERISHFQTIITDSTGEKSNKTAALDTMVATLAYYATAPDTVLAKGLFAGADLLRYIGKNKFLTTYLVDMELYTHIYQHQVSPGFTYLSANFLERSKFLRSPDPVGLLTDSGPFDFNFAREQAKLPAPKLSTLTASATASSDRLAGENYVSNAIIGLTDFIAQRAQEELNYTFLTRLRDELNKNNLNQLFPNTVKFLPGLDLLNYKSILPSIRQAFTKDLNQLSFNLGNYLGASSKNGYADPKLASILLIYQVLELGIRDVSVADILGFTVSRLASNREGLKAAINFELSDTNALATSARQDLVDALEQLDGSVRALDRAAEKAVSDVDDIKNGLRRKIGALGRGDSLQLEYARLKSANIGNTELAFDQRWAKNAGEQPRGILKSWVLGQEAAGYYQANPSLAYFDRLYSGDAKKSSPKELSTAGLIGVRAFISKQEELDFYYRYEDTLVKYAAAYRSINQQLAQRGRKYAPKGAVDALAQRIKAEEAAVKEAGKNTLPYDLLHRLTEEFPSLPDSTEETKIIRQTKDLLSPIESRFLQRVAQDSLVNSPEKQREKVLEGAGERSLQFPDLRKATDRVSADFDRLSKALDMATEKTADTLATALGNVNTYASIFGMSQQLFFLLHRDNTGAGAGEYEKTEAIAPVLLDGDQSMLLRGITYQRLTSVPEFGSIDPRQLGSLMLDFSTILDRLHQPLTTEERMKPQVAKRIRTVEFVTEATRTILEAPVLTLPGADTTFSLSQHVDAFANVPELSTQFNEMFRLSQTGQYRYAVTNLLEIVKLFDPPTATSRKSLLRKRTKLADLKSSLIAAPQRADVLQKQIGRTIFAIQTLEKRDSLRMSNNFFTYATFMADVAAADDSEAFVAALRSVALPKGSSTFKRNNNASLEISALAGLSVCRETLIRPRNLQGATFNENAVVASVFMPVGLMYSNKLRSPSKSARKGTFSLFTTILDLGAVAAFRFGAEDSPVEALPELKLSNIISPGVHVLYQWPGSPFSTGLGVQNGPNVRKYDPGTGAAVQDLRAYRVMVSFAIDVPIFRLWGSN